MATLLCVEACTSDPCVEACLADASPAARTRIEALVTCSEGAGCGEDDDGCLEANCSAELVACAGTWSGDGGVPDGGGGTSDELPNRFEGTTRDHTPNFGGAFDLDSNAQVVFVRDDAAGAQLGYPATHAFYRLESITYRATYGGEVAGCTYSADETETEATAMPETWENNLIIEKAASSGGMHRYDFSTAVTVNHPNGLTIACPEPVGTTYTNFNAEHHVTTGTTEPLTDGTSLVGSSVVSIRNFAWELHAAD